MFTSCNNKESLTSEEKEQSYTVLNNFIDAMKSGISIKVEGNDFNYDFITDDEFIKLFKFDEWQANESVNLLNNSDLRITVSDDLLIVLSSDNDIAKIENNFYKTPVNVCGELIHYIKSINN